MGVDPRMIADSVYEIMMSLVVASNALFPGRETAENADITTNNHKTRLIPILYSTS